MNRRGRLIVLTRSRGREKPAPAADFMYQLEVPGRVTVPEAACAISAETRSCRRAARRARSGVSPGEATRLSSRPAVWWGRLRSGTGGPGDMFRPLGLDGRKKLQDFFVDEKIDRFEREITPVIVDSAGQIVWVAGHALAEEFRVTDTTKYVVILKRLPV